MAKEKKEILRFTTPPFVVSYPHVFTAQRMEGQPNSKPKFTLQAIWTPANFGEKDKKLWGNINRAIVKSVKEKFKVKGENRMEVQRALLEKFDNAKMGIRNGKAREGQEGYGPGTWFATLGTLSPPGIIDMKGNTISVAEGNADEIYPGCICRATVTVFAYDNMGKGYSLGLGNLQKIKDGTRLDSRVAAEDDFDEELDGAWLDENEGGDEDENFGDDD